ncbi:MAG: polymer-forming cytoskeletal protein [Saprospiraceae bacterium]|jgi:cytoskeletal protein CcmA (bactofilin family)|nr:polymer-forming cytoskeletal protein [Saprospiraceae bacterium]MBK6564321.1 polymer-forming cytoskeletal protein [Saprospiraceae bacterium]MBK6782491.1 polymer-forming cytoskeletal protein [Saprospiraceae bacterium]MBK7523997.1 polymer-forming cytoskeletal protein [Saprospiraceae bacterium]MBK8079036.1 polymer-forming cytoskeletal protein [Saprospiraceae bacterium]
MFGSKNDKSSSNTNPVATNVSNSIVEGTKITGDIIASNDIRIDGELTGNLDCNGRVIIGPQGKVEGKIQAQNAIIEGNFLGEILIRELLSIKENASVIADIRTDKISIQPGAVFSGNCTMAGQKLKPLVNKEMPQAK